MNKQTFAFVLVLAVITAAAVWLLDPWAAGRVPGQPTITDAGSDPAELRTAESDHKTVERTAERQARPAVAADSDEDPSYTAALARMRGRLVWKQSREPIPGVKVQGMEFWADMIAPSFETLAEVALSGKPVKPRDPVIFRGQDTTDAEGYFEIDGVHSRAIHALAIGLRTDKAAIRIIARAPGKAETVDLGEIEIQERGTVTGRVVDGDGNPVTGARVRVLDIPTIALNFGLTRFRADGLVMYGMSQKAGPTNVLALPRWVAERDKDLPFAEATTDGQGEFTAAGARPGQATVLVTKDGLLPATKLTRVKPEASRSVGTLKLKPGKVLEGVVVDTEDHPAAGVKIAVGSMLNMAPVGFLHKPVETGIDGKFRVSGLARGNLFVAYTRDGTGWEISGPHQGGDHVRIVLPGLHSATVVVRDASGHPISDVGFSLSGGAELSMVPGFERRLPLEGKVKKDPERPGTWKLVGIPEGSYKLTAVADRFCVGVAELAVAKDKPEPTVTISLLPAAQAEFTVVDALGQHPVAGAKIYWATRRCKLAQQNPDLRRLSPIPILLGRTDHDGRLVSNRVPKGATKFFARHPAYAIGGSGEQVVGRGAPVRFVLHRGGHVEGIVTKRGMPPGEIKTLIAQPRGIRVGEGWNTPRFTVTDIEGKFRFRNLDPGKWRIEPAPDLGKFTSPNDLAGLMMAGMVVSSEDALVTVVENQTVQARIELEARSEKDGAGVVSGIVRLNNQPAKDVVVSSWSGSRRVASKVDENGRFRLGGFKDGTHSVRFFKGGSRMMMYGGLWRETVKIEKENEVVLDVDLYLGSLEVELVDPQGVPLPGVGVQISGTVESAAGRKGSSTAVAVSDTDGRASFEDVPYGTYSLYSQQGDANKFVFPRTTVVVGGSSPGVIRVRAVPAVTFTGTVRFDTTGLTPDEVAHVNKRKPRWLTVDLPGGGDQWSQLKESGGELAFEVNGLAPGKFKLGTWGGTVGWHHDGIVIPVGGLTTIVTLKPNDRDLDRYRKSRDAKNKPKGPSK